MYCAEVLRVVSYFNGGLQLLCCCRGSQASSRPAVWYHPKVSDAFGCRARVACPVVALSLGFCFMLRLAAISTGLWLFLEAGSFIEYLLMFQCELAHSAAFQIVSTLNGSALCQEPLCTLNLQLLIYSFNCRRYSHLNLYLISYNINKFLNRIIKHNNILNLTRWYFIHFWSIRVSVGFVSSMIDCRTLYSLLPVCTILVVCLVCFVCGRLV